MLAVLLQTAAVIWSPTCGRVVSTSDTGTTMVYEAPATPPAGGKCLVIGTRIATGHADTSVVLLAAGGQTIAGSYLAPFDVWTDFAPACPPFTGAVIGTNAGDILDKLAWGKRCGLTMVLTLVGGSHANYLTDQCPNYAKLCASSVKVPTFDRVKWTAKLQTYNTAPIKAALSQCATESRCLVNVMDEPHVSGGTDEAGAGAGNTWGPRGTMTKARVDSLCTDVKALVPGMIALVSASAAVFDPTHDYRQCDGFIPAYSRKLGTPAAWRDVQLAFAKRSKVSVLFGVNPINGGTQDATVKAPGVWDCKAEGGVKGQSSPNCAATGAQFTDAMQVLGPAGCGLVVWKFVSTSYARLKAEYATGVATMKAMPWKSCRRTG